MRTYKLEERIGLLKVRKKWALIGAVALAPCFVVLTALVAYSSLAHESFTTDLLLVTLLAESLVVFAVQSVEHRRLKSELELLDMFKQIIAEDQG